MWNWISKDARRPLFSDAGTVVPAAFPDKVKILNEFGAAVFQSKLPRVTMRCQHGELWRFFRRCELPVFFHVTQILNKKPQTLNDKFFVRC
jgi:hypothetical protein